MEDYEMKCFGVGRFVADPVIQEVNDTKVCKFSLAINEYRKVNGERKKFAHFFDFEVWDKAAELIHQYRKKGDVIEVHSTARQQRWNDKVTGEARNKIVFRVDSFTFWARGDRPQEDAVEEEEQVVVDKEETPF